MSEIELRNETITEENKFDLSIWRSMDQRIEMVQDPDCPTHIIETVIEYDLDQQVVLATLLSPQLTPELLQRLSEKHNYSLEELETKRNFMQTKKTDQRSQVFCGVPWNHVSTQANGSIRMCCQMINSDGFEGEEAYGTVFKDNGEVLTTQDDLSKHRNSLQWKRLRKEMLEGIKSPICKLCWDEEANGIGSRREWTNDVFDDLFDRAVAKTQPDGTIDHADFPIEHWDLRFGNKCNLACRSCGPGDSDLWYKDWIAMQGRNTFFTRGTGDVEITLDEKGTATVKDSPFEWFDKGDLLTTIQNSLHEIKRFYFTGGEPTINHTHRQLLQYAIDNNYAKDIVLDYNTNMAGVPKAIFEQWKQFKEVNLGMSIDGIYEHFEYIRHPGKWKTAYKNMCKVDREQGFEHLNCSITMTVSIMNVLHILDMQWWMKEQNWNRIDNNIIVHNLYGPRHLNTQHLPKDMKKYITDRYYKFLKDIKEQWPDEIDWYHLVEQRLQSILQHMNGNEDDPEIWKLWFYETGRLDKIRNEDWRKSLPELEQMIKFCKGQEMRKRDVKLATASKRK
jgi:MoaA/NifB/PqqE/SkfB family radical SAM enzyme